MRKLAKVALLFFCLDSVARTEAYVYGRVTTVFDVNQNADDAVAQYRSTVITAFQNVTDSLRALQSEASALTAAVAAERAAAKTLNITRRQLELGQVAYLLFINAEQTCQQAIVSLVQARANHFAVNTCQSLNFGLGTCA